MKRKGQRKRQVYLPSLLKTFYGLCNDFKNHRNPKQLRTTLVQYEIILVYMYKITKSSCVGLVVSMNKRIFKHQNRNLHAYRLNTRTHKHTHTRTKTQVLYYVTFVRANETPFDLGKVHSKCLVEFARHFISFPLVFTDYVRLL